MRSITSQVDRRFWMSVPNVNKIRVYIILINIYNIVLRNIYILFLYMVRPLSGSYFTLVLYAADMYTRFPV